MRSKEGWHARCRVAGAVGLAVCVIPIGLASAQEPFPDGPLPAGQAPPEAAASRGEVPTTTSPYRDNFSEEVPEAVREAEIEAWEGDHERASSEVRVNSATVYADLSRGSASDLATATFPAYFDMIVAATVDEDEDVLRYPSEEVALVAPSASLADRELVISNTPLVIEGETGSRVEVDSTLVPSGDVYRPEEVGTTVTFPSDLEEGIEIGSDPIAFNLAAAEGATSPTTVVEGQALFYGDAAGEDADLILSSIAGGFRFAVQVRSENSPERIALPIDLSSGDQLRVDDLTHAATVVREDAPDVSISPPIALDADGRAVPVSMKVEGDTFSACIEPQKRQPALSGHH